MFLGDFSGSGAGICPAWVFRVPWKTAGVPRGLGLMENCLVGFLIRAVSGLVVRFEGGLWPILLELGLVGMLCLARMLNRVFWENMLDAVRLHGPRGGLA